MPIVAGYVRIEIGNVLVHAPISQAAIVAVKQRGERLLSTLLWDPQCTALETERYSCSAEYGPI